MGSPTTEDLPRLRRKTSEQLLRDETLSAAEREDIIKQHLPAQPQSGRADEGTYDEGEKEQGKEIDIRGRAGDAACDHHHGHRPSSSSSSSSQPKQQHAQRLSFWAWLATAIKAKIHYMAYIAISLVVGFWIRGRHAYRAIVERILAIVYHHHRTPELIQRDVKGLSRLPLHLSCVLKRKREEEDGDIEGVGQLGDDVAELVAWTSCAGIPMLSIYERTGALKAHIPELHRAIVKKLAAYYGFLAQQPTVYLYAPHHPIYSPELIAPDQKTNHSAITVLLLSVNDGRETLVDLTKTLAEMAQHGKISPHDISVKLVDAELSEIISPMPMHDDGDAVAGDAVGQDIGESTALAAAAAAAAAANTSQRIILKTGEAQSVSESATAADEEHEYDSSAPFVKSEPDLLIVFGPYLKLDGYPPWAIRLTEIYCTGDKGDLITSGGGETVEYQKFLKGLWRYAKAEMRFGR